MALVGALLVAVMLPHSANAAFRQEHSSLRIDRLAAGSTAHWDESIGSWRQAARWEVPRFGNTTNQVVLPNPTPVAEDNCGSAFHVGTFEAAPSGAGVASGDVNGDGLDDVVFGCAGDDTSAADAGAVVVYLRNSSNSGFAAAVELPNPAPTTAAACGAAVALGDVNADGRDDIVAGCPLHDTSGNNNAGALLVFTRLANNSGFSGGTMLPNPSPNPTDRCGIGVSVGDVNGDGREDPIAGCTQNEAWAGHVGVGYVFTRSITNTGYDAAVALTSTGVNSECGFAVTVADVNGDGRGDVALGCATANAGASASGAVRLFMRNTANTGFEPFTTLTEGAPVANDRCGRSVSSGDVNRDGRDDIVMGCPGNDHKLVLMVRNASNTGFDAQVMLDASPMGLQQCGWSVKIADVNGDGADDVVGGCIYYGGAGTPGKTIVFLRNAANSGFHASYDVRWRDDGTVPAPQCGSGLSAGDVDGDGREELLMACRNAQVSGVGVAGLIVVADAIAVRGELADTTPAASDACGTGRTTAVGDFNDDGYDDVAFSCPGDDAGVSGSGSVVVHFRASGGGGFSSTDELKPHTPTLNDNCAAITAGDVNGDGRDDILLGCTLTGTPGRVMVFHRNAANTDFEAATLLTMPVIGLGACGTSVAIGDVDGDGIDDPVAGCPGSTLGGSLPDNAEGAAVAWPHLANGAFGTGEVVQDPSPKQNQSCGHSVAVGDVNNDDLDDLVLGCYQYVDGFTVNSGKAMVVRRKATNDGFESTVTDLYNPSNYANDWCGATVGTGDIDGDGRTDVLMGCSNDHSTFTNGGSVVYFRSSGAAFAAAVELPPTVGDTVCGASMAVTDVNGDGRDDIVLGCPGGDVGAANAGGIRMHVLSPTGWLTSFVPNPAPTAEDRCGSALGSGDVNGDGRGDVAIGCPNDDGGGADSGNVVVLLAASTGTVGTLGTASQATEVPDPTPTTSDRCGRSSAVGDLNGDGRADLVVGCPQDDTLASNAGAVVVHLRNATNTGYVAGTSLVDPSPGADDQCGYRVATADVNGDGRDDVISACPHDETGASDAGNALVYIRDSANSGFEAAVPLVNPTPVAGDRCATSVAAGDVNDDGRDDVVLGCLNDDTNASNTGNAIVYLRNAANAAFEAGHELHNPSPGAADQCGMSVAVGDVNDDRLDDVAIGCHLDDGAALNAGGVVLFPRRSDNLDFDPAVELFDATPEAEARCANALSIGDVNADGRADIAAACHMADAGAADAGNAVVFVRNVANTTFLASTQLDPPGAIASEACGTSIDVGDVDGDGRGDVAIGCPSDATGAVGAGSVLVFRRAQPNTSFETGVDVPNPTPAAGDNCGSSVAVGDVDEDGRGDVVTGCESVGTGSISVYADRSTVLATTRFNRRNGTVQDVTIGATTVRNGAGAASWEVSANGGTSWANATPGAMHTFGVPGNDLRLRARIRAGGTPNASDVIRKVAAGYNFNVIGSYPDMPVHLSPAPGGSTPDLTPTLEARYLDPDVANTGTLHFEVCSIATPANQSCSQAGGTILASGSSAGGNAVNAPVTWTVPSTLTAPQTVHWHAYALDSDGNVSQWSATTSLQLVDQLIVSVDPIQTIPPSLVAGTEGYASFRATVTTNRANGYKLEATDDSDTYGTRCACPPTPVEVPDWAATEDDPTEWAPGVGPFAGFTVTDVDGVVDDRLAKWGDPNSAGWPMEDTDHNDFIGLRTTAAVLHSSSVAAPDGDDVEVAWRFTTATTTPSGQYVANLTFTALPNP